MNTKMNWITTYANRSNPYQTFKVNSMKEKRIERYCGHSVWTIFLSYIINFTFLFYQSVGPSSVGSFNSRSRYLKIRHRITKVDPYKKTNIIYLKLFFENH